MHGGLPFIGFSTIVYGVVGLAVAAGGAVTRFRRRK
ncbi:MULTISPECIES: LPXTG cell wall anchor domain-containing protein [Actinoallomurus]|nr:LPXTG cell wall anchor domain-containing protein [Actinoallomurus sp. NBC_01490]